MRAYAPFGRLSLVRVMSESLVNTSRVGFHSHVGSMAADEIIGRDDYPQNVEPLSRPCRVGRGTRRRTVEAEVGDV